MESFDELVDNYTPMIYKIMKSLHIYKNKEEFFQIGLIGLWEAHSRFNSEKGSFLNYAYTYIKGLFLTELIKQNKASECLDFPDDIFWGNLASPKKEEVTVSSYLADLCLPLTAQERIWVHYTCREGLSIKEIAKKEKVSMSAVKNWRKQAREKLRDRISMVDFE
ncbi:sigma-70 family RNA polymerase sigma factor [Bacillus marasmi]|uniref:sigma-70 family RNA polymerase sigma factor n=1 Tax=Bacillus marasmi TaxID=1926279 RepID=UPI0011CA8AE3|nr:sigma-70 family RNA polymerase sigma factor [Bacillus marasmi]